MVKIEKLTRKRNSAKKKFDDEVRNFEIVLGAQPEIHHVEEAFNEVKQKYKTIRELHNDITEVMVKTRIKETDFTNHNNFIKEIICIYGHLLSKFEHYRKQCEVKTISAEQHEVPP